MEARALLRDWLSNFVYGLVQAFTLAAHENDLDEADRRSPNRSKGGSSRESALSEPLVWKITRLIYGLLHSPILDPNGVSADERWVLFPLLIFFMLCSTRRKSQK